MAQIEDKELDAESAKLFAKGFNAGYQIQKDDPKLLATLTKQGQNADKLYIQGMIAGGKEQLREKYLEEFRKTKSKAKTKDKDFER